MITLGLSQALALYSFVAVGSLLWVWFWSYRNGRGTGERFNPTDFVQQCPYCGHVLLDYRKLDLIVCPVCNSYFEGRCHGIASK